MRWYKNYIHKICLLFLMFLGNIFPASGQETEKTLTSLIAKLEVSDEQKAEFRQRAEDKTKELSEYLNVVSSKRRSREERVRAIDLACKLFINNADTTKVQVSSLNRDKLPLFYTREYLGRLMALQYDQVSLTWSEKFYVSRLIKNVDGTYTGVVTARQLFRGIKDGKIVYQDVTDKNIEIHVKPYQIQIGDTIEIKWDVFLGHILVKETREK